MNYRFSISIKSLIFINIAIIGIATLALSLALELRLALIFGAGLLLLGLLRFPAPIVAMNLEGVYLYFLVLQYTGISPESNITGAYYLGMRLIALLVLVIYLYLRHIPAKIFDINAFAVMLFSSYILIQYALFSHTFGASKKLIFFIIQGILMFFIGRLLTKELMLKTLKYSLGLACFLSIYSIIRIIMSLGNVGKFFTGGLWNYHGQVYFLMTGIIIAICFYFFRSKPKISVWWHIAFWLYLALALIESIIASSRGGIIGFIATMIIFAVYVLRKFISNFAFRLRHIFIAILLIFIFVVFWNIMGNNLLTGITRLSGALQLIDLASGEISEEESASSLQARIHHITSQYHRFSNNPVLGFGFGNSSESYAYVHNMFLEVLFETGIIGLILFIGIIFLVFKKILYIWANSNRNFAIQNIASITIVMLWFYFMITGLFSRSLFDNYQFWFCTGVLMSPIENRNLLKIVLDNNEQSAEC